MCLAGQNKFCEKTQKDTNSETEDRMAMELKSERDALGKYNVDTTDKI